MENYSEKELLMLSNYIYLNAANDDCTIGESLAKYCDNSGNFTPESVINAGTGGGLDNDQVSQLFKEMDKECKNNPEFADLSPARRLEEKDVRGICYTNSKDENPVIVFRGTGGTKEAWQDNMYGGFVTDTRIQKVANDFVKYECGNYSNCVVTGHSKGGNLSQYVTIMNGDMIKRCVSFDGQGMNNDFISMNADKIAHNAGKIKSISAYNDFVNILLTCIAGEAIYVNNKKNGVNAHSSFYLLDSNEFDENGNFANTMPQSKITTAIKSVTDEIVDVLGFSSETDNLILGGILGEAISTLMDIDSVDELKEGLSSTANQAMMAFSLKMKRLFDDPDADIKALPSGGVYFDLPRVNNVAQMYDSKACNTNRLISQTEVIKESLDYDIATRFYTDIALARIVEDMQNAKNKLFDLQRVICDAGNIYNKRETSIAFQIQSVEL